MTHNTLVTICRKSGWKRMRVSVCEYAWRLAGLKLVDADLNALELKLERTPTDGDWILFKGVR